MMSKKRYHNADDTDEETVNTVKMQLKVALMEEVMKQM